MANTFELIASYSATGSVSSIDFTSIPSTFTDLCLKLSVTSASAGGAAANGYYMTFNGLSTNRTYRRLYAVPNSAYSDSGSNMPVGSTNGTSIADVFSNDEIFIPNYAGSTNKSSSVDFTIEANTTATALGFVANLWSSTAAINRITLTPDAGNFRTYSTAYLYGVRSS